MNHQELSLGRWLLEMKANYQKNPAFLFPVPEGGIKQIRYQKFLMDLRRGTRQAMEMTEQRVAVISYSLYEWLVTAFSLLLAGKTLILINPDLGDQELISLLRYTDAEAVCVSEDLRDELGFLGGCCTLSAMCGTAEREDALPEEVIGELPAKKSEMICFTSGTLSSSKGVVIETEMLVKHSRLIQKEKIVPFKALDRVFIPVPLYHMYGLTFLTYIIAEGAVACFSTSPRYLVQQAAGCDPQVAILVPSMIRPLFSQDHLMPHLQAITLAGSALRKDLADLARAQGVKVYNIYGASETVGIILASHPDEDEQWMYPFSFVQCKLGEKNELYANLPFHLKEYYKKPEQTQAVLDGDVLHTGDAVCLSETGAVKIMGRIREMIVMENGEKIHAEDMDRMIAAIQGVREGAIVYSAETGINAVVVPFGMNQEKEIRQGVEQYNKSAGPQFRIRQLWIREQALPRTVTGKLQRVQLQKQYESWKLSLEGKKDG